MTLATSKPEFALVSYMRAQEFVVLKTVPGTRVRRPHSTRSRATARCQKFAHRLLLLLAFPQDLCFPLARLCLIVALDRCSSVLFSKRALPINTLPRPRSGKVKLSEINSANTVPALFLIMPSDLRYDCPRVWPILLVAAA